MDVGAENRGEGACDHSPGASSDNPGASPDNPGAPEWTNKFSNGEGNRNSAKFPKEAKNGKLLEF